MRRVLAWLRNGRRLHADVMSGRYALRRWYEATADALAECKAERDAADAVIRRYGSGWWPDRISASWFDVIGEDDEGNERPAEPLTPAEAEALRRARAAQPQEGGTGG